MIGKTCFEALSYYGWCVPCCYRSCWPNLHIHSFICVLEYKYLFISFVCLFVWSSIYLLFCISKNLEKPCFITQKYGYYLSARLSESALSWWESVPSHRKTEVGPEEHQYNNESNEFSIHCYPVSSGSGEFWDVKPWVTMILELVENMTPQTCTTEEVSLLNRNTIIDVADIKHAMLDLFPCSTGSCYWDLW